MVGVKKETRSATSAVGYIRVSTEEQVLGPDAQRVALEQWAVARQVELLAVFEDRGVSGATPLDRRPGLLAALECMAKSRAGWLVAAKRDRFARDVIIAAQLERLVSRDGGQLVSADGASDGDSPEATLMRRIIDCMSEYERCLIRGRTRPPSRRSGRRGSNLVRRRRSAGGSTVSCSSLTSASSGRWPASASSPPRVDPSGRSPRR